MWDPVQGSVAKNVKFVAYGDMNGRPDGCQVVKHGDYLYVGHFWSAGVSILDVKDPRNPMVVSWIPSPPNSWNTNVQVADDLLLVADEWLIFGGDPNQSFHTGVRVFDVSDPRKPQELSYIAGTGRGAHRSWYPGGRYAYLSIQPEGFANNILVIYDLSNPRQPQEVSRWWLPGMHTAGGEQRNWKEGERYWNHGCVVAGDRAYCGWWDAGMVILDISDIRAPKFVSRFDYSPPFGGATHTCLPLPQRGLVVVADEALADNCEEGQKLIWMFDVREETNPIPVAIFPVPKGSFQRPGARFGPHNLHENRPGSFQSDRLIFDAYFDAGLRIFDIADPYRPEEVGCFVPPPPARMIDPRPGKALAPSSQDVHVDKNGLMYLTDYNVGLYVLEYTG